MKIATGRGVTVSDQGDYFRVKWEDEPGSLSTFPKDPDGFADAAELLGWLIREGRCNEPCARPRCRDAHR